MNKLVLPLNLSPRNQQKLSKLIQHEVDSLSNSSHSDISPEAGDVCGFNDNLVLKTMPSSPKLKKNSFSMTDCFLARSKTLVKKYGLNAQSSLTATPTMRPKTMRVGSLSSPFNPYLQPQTSNLNFRTKRIHRRKKFLRKTRTDLS